MLVLIVADLFTPDRTPCLPSKFQQLLSVPGRIDKVLCLGALDPHAAPSTTAFLRSLPPNPHQDFLHIEGDSVVFPLALGTTPADSSSPAMTSSTTASASASTSPTLRVGALHGPAQCVPSADPLALLSHARMMDADVLLWAGTHRAEAYTLDGRFFVNPGTATGAYSTHSDEPCCPSFCLLETGADDERASCTLYVYTLVDEEVKIDRLQYAKD